MQNDRLLLLDKVAQIIFDKKGANILALDVSRISSLTDYVIIAEGSVDRHVIAIAAAIQEGLKKIGEMPLHVAGMQTGDWVVLDYMHIMVHLFMPGVREKYQLEQLWKEAEIVDLHIELSAKGSI
jgi:ribosome-associated protein